MPQQARPARTAALPPNLHQDAAMPDHHRLSPWQGVRQRQVPQASAVQLRRRLRRLPTLCESHLHHDLSAGTDLSQWHLSGYLSGPQRYLRQHLLSAQPDLHQWSM